jgi:hypothetical protein
MRTARVVALTLAVVVALGSAAVAGPSAKDKPPKPVKVKSYKPGELFCPAAVLVVGGVVIQPGRCYVLLVLRDSQGTFLAFAAPDVRIPPGQLVRLNTPAGAKLRGRIFYLVPLRTTAAIVPMNSVAVIAVKEEDFGPRLSLTLISASANLTVVFSVRI